MHKNSCSNDGYHDLCSNEIMDGVIEPEQTYSSANYQIDVTNSSSLPVSPRRDNLPKISSLQYISGNSLSNSFDSLSRGPPVSESEITCPNEDHIVAGSLKSTEAYNNDTLVIEKKRKISNMFLRTGSFADKIETFVKIFENIDVTKDPLLTDFSCALAKNSRSIPIQGRIYITEKSLCFYSRIISFENKIIIPISGIINVSKEKTARVIPNALKIVTETDKYFFTSFGARDKAFHIIVKLWQNSKDIKKSSEVRSVLIKDEDCIPSFIVGNGSDSDTELSSYSNNLNQIVEIEEKFQTEIKYRKKSRCIPVVNDTKLQKELNRSNTVPSRSATTLSNVTKPPNDISHHPQIDKRMKPQSCSDHDHFQKFYLDEEVEMNVDKLFSCVFTHSSFFKRFCEYRKTVNVIQSSWPEKFSENGFKTRKICYTLTLKARIGPKISATEEKQIFHDSSKTGIFYMVDTEVRNSGFPLSDCFHSLNRYCLLYVSGSKSRIKVSSQIVYDKPLFFGSKSLIESTAKSGLTDYFTDLGKALKYEARSPLRHIHVNHSHGPLPDIDDTKHGSIPQSQSSQDSATISLSASGAHFSFPDDFNSSPIGFMRVDRLWCLLIVLSLILCLCLSFLYSRFRQLEDITNIQINRQFEAKPDWRERWQNHDQNSLDELSQWKLLVENSIDLIDQMRHVLVTIKSNLHNLSDDVQSSPMMVKEQDLE